MNELAENMTQSGGRVVVDSEVAGLLASSVERILEDLCTPAMLRAMQGGDAQAVQPLWSAIEGAGLLDAMRTRDEGLGWLEVRAVVEACGRWGVPVPLAETLAAQALARLAGAELPAGSASLGIARVQGGLVVFDSVPFPTLAERVVCSLADAFGGADRLMVFDRGDAGIELGANGAGDERGAMRFARDRGTQLGVLPAGASSLTVGAAIRAAQIAGACERVVQTATRYASDRVQFDRPIGKFQAIQQQLAVAAEWSAMASMAAQLALCGPGVSLDPIRVAAAKQVAGTAAQTCADIAHAVHGAIGVTAEYDLQLYTRRLWSWAGEFGSSLYWARTLGAELLADGPVLSWDAVVRASTP